MRRPRLCLASADSEALRGCRPGPIRGSATEVGRTGTGSGGKPLCRKAAKSPEARSLSHKSRDGASERRILLLPRRVVRRSISPQGRGEDQLKAQLARRRGNVNSWLFESMKSEFEKDVARHAASYAGLTRVSITLRKTLA